jgi:predicted aspartyl protease
MAAVSEQLTFNQVYQYDTRLAGISIPVKVQWGSVSAEVEARLDTGSSHCVFRRADAALLGIDVTGLPQTMHTVAGDFLTYAHEVTLVVLGIETTTTVYFAADESFLAMYLVARVGWIVFDWDLWITTEGCI